MTNGNIRSVFIKDNGMKRTGPEYIMEEIHSPTDSSEDSVEVKVEAITSRSKRKLVEPRRINDLTGPLKKRICLRTEEATPFRPWNTSTPEELPPKINLHPKLLINPQPTNVRHSYFRPPSPIRANSPEPVDLIIKPELTIKEEPIEDLRLQQQHTSAHSSDDIRTHSSSEDLRMPIHPSPSASLQEAESSLSTSLDAFPKLQANQRKEQRNYKNMTRERRIEANARERTRVHTISAAFDTLRHSVPAYSHSQKLSKLSVLRIACSYIMTLSNMLDDSPDLAQNVDMVSKTIQREGKLRKKKDDD